MVTHPNVKVNLGLNVLRKREDGYHDLETLFVPYLRISDTLEIIAGDDYSRTSTGLFSGYEASSIVQGISPDGKLMITIARREGVGWDPLKDLTAKAYSLLDADFNLPAVKIFLEKKAPVGAGLGGGSSDAAFTLRMLSEMFSLSLDDTSLAGYASRLGSDCAFFVYNRPMIGSSKGEVLEDYALEGLDYGQGGLCGWTLKVIIPEGISVSTADAYKGIVPATPVEGLKDILALPINRWKGRLANDFEKTVFAKYPLLGEMKSGLYREGAVYASMSGSGSALYGIWPTSL